MDQLENLPPVNYLEVEERVSALKSEARLRILRLLAGRGLEWTSTGVISNLMVILPSALSHHLNYLRRYDLIQMMREGKHTMYRVNAQGVESLIREIQQTIFGAPEHA